MYMRSVCFKKRINVTNLYTPYLKIANKIALFDLPHNMCCKYYNVYRRQHFVRC